MDEALQSQLTENNLAGYIPLFEEQHLFEWEDFADLTEADFEKIGITKLGDRKRLLRLFSAPNPAAAEESTVPAVVETIEYGDKTWDWMDSDLDNRHLVYRYGDSSKKYCPSCFRRIYGQETECPGCGHSFSYHIDVPQTAYEPSLPVSQPAPESDMVRPIVINNMNGRSYDSGSFSDGMKSGFLGVTGGFLGAVIGAIAVIALVLIVLSNETLAL